MWTNTDCFLQADYDRYQDSLNEVDECIEVDSRICQKCYALIDEDSILCDNCFETDIN